MLSLITLLTLHLLKAPHPGTSARLGSGKTKGEKESAAPTEGA
jgi:hypothetical protein